MSEEFQPTQLEQSEVEQSAPVLSQERLVELLGPIPSQPESVRPRGPSLQAGLQAALGPVRSVPSSPAPGEPGSRFNPIVRHREPQPREVPTVQPKPRMLLIPEPPPFTDYPDPPAPNPGVSPIDPFEGNTRGDRAAFAEGALSNQSTSAETSVASAATQGFIGGAVGAMAGSVGAGRGSVANTKTPIKFESVQGVVGSDVTTLRQNHEMLARLLSNVDTREAMSPASIEQSRFFLNSNVRAINTVERQRITAGLMPPRADLPSAQYDADSLNHEMSMLRQGISPTTGDSFVGFDEEPRFNVPGYDESGAQTVSTKSKDLHKQFPELRGVELRTGSAARFPELDPTFADDGRTVDPEQDTGYGR